MTQATPHSDGQFNGSPAALDHKLRALWRRQRWHAHGRGLAAVTLTLALLIVAALLLDWLVELPPVTRLLLLAGMVATVLAVAYRQWWVHLRPFDARRAALQVERHHPQLGSALIAYVQFGQAVDGSTQLAAAARQHAARLAERMSFGELVRFGDLRSLGFAATATVLVVVAVSAVWPTTMATFAHRMANPFSEQPYPTRTQVTLETGDQRVPRGAVVPLEAQVSGVMPAEGQLEIRYDDTDTWEMVAVRVDDEGRLQHRLASADHGFDYRFSAGDGHSSTAHVDVVMPPRVRRATVTLEHPDYTGIGEQTSESLNIRAPEGTQATLRLELERPASALELIELDEAGEAAGEPREFTLSEQGRVATLAMPVQTMNYRLRSSRAVEGETFQFNDPVRYQMRAVPDAPPRVQILEPTRRSEIGTVNKRLPLVFRASDDHGLTEAWVVYRHEGSEQEHRVAIGELEGRSSSRNTFTWSLGETIDDLEAGDEVEYTVEVADNREGKDDRQRGRAAPWRSIEILSIEAFLQQMAERQVESFERLQEVGAQTSESRDTIRRIEYEVSNPRRRNEPQPDEDEHGGGDEDNVDDDDENEHAEDE